MHTRQAASQVKLQLSLSQLWLNLECTVASIDAAAENSTADITYLLNDQGAACCRIASIHCLPPNSLSAAAARAQSPLQRSEAELKFAQCWHCRCTGNIKPDYPWYWKACFLQKLERLVRAQHTIADLQQQLEHSQQAAQQSKLRFTSELEAVKTGHHTDMELMAQVQQEKTQLQQQLQQATTNAELTQQRLQEVQVRLCCQQVAHPWSRWVRIPAHKTVTVLLSTSLQQ